MTVLLALLSAAANTPLALLSSVGFPRLVVDDDSATAGGMIALAMLVGSPIAAVVGGRLGAQRSSERAHAAPTWSGLRMTEVLAYPLVVVAVLVATQLVDAGDGGSLGALQGWTLAAALAIGYMVSRGFAKSRRRARAQTLGITRRTPRSNHRHGRRQPALAGASPFNRFGPSGRSKENSAWALTETT